MEKSVFRKNNVIGLVAVSLFALLLVNSAVAVEMVPFKALATGSASVDASAFPILSVTVVSGSGRATHMGRFVITYQHHYVNAFTGEFFGGTYLWTAANGDTIFGTYHGTTVPTSSGFEIHGFFTVDGGSGELVNANGGGTASGMQFNDLTFNLRLDGTISFE